MVGREDLLCIIQSQNGRPVHETVQKIRECTSTGTSTKTNKHAGNKHAGTAKKLHDSSSTREAVVAEPVVVDDPPADEPAHDVPKSVLVSGSTQLRNAGVVDMTGFGEKMFSKAVVSGPSTTNCNELDNTLFIKSFEDTSVGLHFYNLACNTARSHQIDGSIIMPPLILRADATSVIKFSNGLYLCLFADGPVIPIVPKHLIPKLQTFIKGLYRLESEDFLTTENFNELCFKN